ncbi:MAG TPA: site-2 protease family protein [Candidatus Saccharimonadales bacterium]|nr:site-2 protease family protein [Candidatus Saccharimonadales bacterium]
MSLDLGYVIVVLVVVLLSMTLHEAMHAFAGHWLGDDTARLSGRLTLNPLKHLDPFLSIILPVMLALLHLPVFGGAKPVPFNPNRVRYGDFGAALVAIAGPLTNLVLAFLAFAIYVGLGLPSTDTTAGLFMTAAVFVNLGFFVFNIIPIPPLDGSRVIYAIAPDGIRAVMEMIERQGIILVFLVVLLFNQQIAYFMGSAIQFFVQAFAQLFGVQVL